MSENLYDICMFFKLTTGDSILCQVLTDSKDNVIIKDPVQINTVHIPAENGIRASIFYSRWFQGTDSRIHMIRKHHILSAAIPNKSTVEQYNTTVSDYYDKPSPKNNNPWFLDRFKN